MCKKSCGDCVEKGFEGVVTGGIGPGHHQHLHSRETSRMGSGKRLLVWVGREPGASSLSGAGQAETRW